MSHQKRDVWRPRRWRIQQTKHAGPAVREPRPGPVIQSHHVTHRMQPEQLPSEQNRMGLQKVPTWPQQVLQHRRRHMQIKARELQLRAHLRVPAVPELRPHLIRPCGRQANEKIIQIHALHPLRRHGGAPSQQVFRGGHRLPSGQFAPVSLWRETQTVHKPFQGERLVKPPTVKLLPGIPQPPLEDLSEQIRMERGVLNVSSG